MTQTEGNKIIAEWLGYKIWYKDGNVPLVEISENNHVPVSEFKNYHSDWNELIKAVSFVKSVYDHLKQEDAQVTWRSLIEQTDTHYRMMNT